MRGRRPTSEQQRAVMKLRALAAPYRFRVTVDTEGLPMIPGRYGRIEWHCDGVSCWSCPIPRQVALAVHTDHPRVFQKLRAIDGVMRHQTGDTEIRAVFAFELLGKVASVTAPSDGVGLAAVAPRTSRCRRDNWPLRAPQSHETPGAKGEAAGLAIRARNSSS
jgi:hypothetical protein